MPRSPAHDARLRQPVLVTCAGCRHFTPDRINRVEGMGFCARFNGWNYPGAQRHCRAFEEKADAVLHD